MSPRRPRRPRGDVAADALAMMVGGLAAGVLELVDIRRREPPGDRLALEFELRRLTPPPLTASPARRPGLRPRDTSE